MIEFEQRIFELLSSPYYQSLATYEPPFNPLEVFGVTRQEKCHSEILFWLLNHSGNRAFQQNFWRWVANQLDTNVEIWNEKNIEIKREFYGSYCDDEKRTNVRLDLFALLRTVKFAIAIEVKVDADEGENQVAKYQKFLENQYGNWKTSVIYLTINGDSAQTADCSMHVSVLCMSWKQIAEFIDLSSESGYENDFRVQFYNHIYRNLMNVTAERKIIIDLLKHGNNKQTIQKIINNYPHLGEYWECFKRVVHELLPKHKNDLVYFEYPKRGRKKTELKCKVNEWDNKGLPFTIMLYGEEVSSIRILIFCDDYKKYRKSLDEFSEFCGDVVGHYPPLVNWVAWHSVINDPKLLSEDDETIIKREIYDEKFWVEVKMKLKSQLDILTPLIDEWPI